MEEDFESDQSIVLFLSLTIGHDCYVAAGTGRYWGSEDNFVTEGDFFQIMSRHDFFHWYKKERPYHQFFKTKQTAAMYYLKFWIYWKTKVSKND